MGNIKQNNQPPSDIEGFEANEQKEPETTKPSVDLIPAKTQAEIDSEMTLVRLKTEKLRLRKEELELEKLENDVLTIQRQREAQRVARETVQESLEFNRQDRIHNETFCTHMKGGDSGNMMHGAPAQGNDASNYAMWQHTLTTGVTFRMCSRCGKTWFPKDPDYRWAMTRPTRNSPSTGSPSPGLVRNPKNVRVVSEVPHLAPPQSGYEFTGLPEYGRQ